MTVSPGSTLVAERRLDTVQFFAIMAAFPTGVTVVTTLDSIGEPRGLTCNAVCSVSADPPLLLVCIDRSSSTLDALLKRSSFVVNFLKAERGQLSTHFATKGRDRFDGIAWQPARNGSPWLHQDTLAHAECTIVRTVDAGDHVVVIASVEDGQSPTPDASPLMYFRRTYGSWR